MRDWSEDHYNPSHPPFNKGREDPPFLKGDY